MFISVLCCAMCGSEAGDRGANKGVTCVFHHVCRGEAEGKKCFGWRTPNIDFGRVLIYLGVSCLMCEFWVWRDGV